MLTSDIAAKALERMSDQELQHALALLAGPLLRELSQRNYSVSLDAPAGAMRDATDAKIFFDFRHAA